MTFARCPVHLFMSPGWKPDNSRTNFQLRPHTASARNPYKSFESCQLWLPKDGIHASDENCAVVRISMVRNCDGLENNTGDVLMLRWKFSPCYDSICRLALLASFRRVMDQKSAKPRFLTDPMIPILLKYSFSPFSCAVAGPGLTRLGGGG